jgi:hypothetical protein
MSTYKKSDLKRNYQWKTTEDDPKLRNEPDSSLFSRHEGWEVLYLANKFAAKKGLSSTSSLHKLEDLLAEKLPSTTHSQEKVYKWLDENW